MKTNGRLSFLPLSALWRAGLVSAAINIKGDPVVNPLGANDPSPMGEINTYYPDNHDCPLPCSDFSNINGWTPYFSIERLNRCPQPMLLKLSVTQPLDDPKTTVLLRSCTLGDSSSSSPTSPLGGLVGSLVGVLAPPVVDNPKKSDDLFESSLEIAPACFASGKESDAALDIRTGGGSGAPEGSVSQLLKGFQSFFYDEDNCDERFIFGYHKKTVAGLYVGAGLGKTTVKSVVDALVPAASSTKRSIAQLCQGRQSVSVIGAAIDASGDLAGIQKTLLAWSNGTCFSDAALTSAKNSPTIKVFDISSQSTKANSTSSATSSTAGTSSKLVSSIGASSKSGSSASAQGSGASSASGTASSQSAFTSSKSSLTSSTAPLPSRIPRRANHRDSLDKRATCRYVKVESGDGCDSLARKCGISGDEFMKYNSASGYCSSLRPGDYACCSSGDRYSDPKPSAPQPSSDGTCATYLIQDGDTCDSLAKKYGILASDIEKWNSKKTWAWTTCQGMLLGYNMCLSAGYPPLPPPQQGSECGPVKPGTTSPSDKSIPMASLNPCPLKACCSNWGFCGPFPAHCDIHAPADGGPGSKLPGYEATCVSNCGTDIKQNSGPPAAFSRIGYYESWNMERSCLWLPAKDANTDGTYTHIHWAFANIDPNTWKPVINDTFKQWDDFKKLTGVKRIVSFGGWAYSTEPATYNIIRTAIIDKREQFATNVAQFVRDEGLDGADIDWEYPGAPDIYVDGKPIGKTSDGIYYYLFINSLKQKLSDKSVSIAAPASYWYLKAFPIDLLASKLDYIVYMTYDLHGQWDYGNVNAFDSCPSGKCIRSHVNLTETRNSLSIITKAGVPNNKIFVGEASYGRSFKMATNYCWGPNCQFTGSRTQSDAQPGRCTNTRGYISNAEIMEMIGRKDGAVWFHDAASNSDILLYNGDYISYMTTTTKDTRRNDWKNMNFAGSIDWAVDLQEFRTADFNKPPNNGAAGTEGCIWGKDLTTDTGDLCEFSCAFDFCPESLCICAETGIIPPLPPVDNSFQDAIAWDEFSLEATRLCRFTCTHGYCPSDTCTKPVIDEDMNGNMGAGPSNEQEAMLAQASKCVMYRDYREKEAFQCEGYCKPQVDAAKAAGRTTNFGCAGFFPDATSIPWQRMPGVSSPFIQGNCLCDNMFLNEIADFVIEALPIIAQIGCYIIMSAFKLVLDIGADLFGAGRAVTVGLDALGTAAQMVNYVYPQGENPQGAFSWWLSPCGGDALVPESLKKAFDILSTVASAGTSFKVPKNIPKGSGRRDDKGNPNDQSKPRSGPGTTGGGANTGAGVQKRCRIKPGEDFMRKGKAKNTILKQSCVNNKTQKKVYIVTTVSYAAQATKIPVVKTCKAGWDQACYHYSSAIRQNPSWATLTCPQEAATTKNPRIDGPIVKKWYDTHNKAWRQPANRVAPICQGDEYPPAYLLSPNDPIRLKSGVDSTGQLIRYLPGPNNGGAASMWISVCLRGVLESMTDSELDRRCQSSSKKAAGPSNAQTGTEMIGLDSNGRPAFSIGTWEQPLKTDDNMAGNPCLTNIKTPVDPGFALVGYDPWYKGNAPPYDYSKAP